MATAQAAQKTNFGWKPVVKIPDVVPAASFLTGTDAQAFLAQYMDKARSDYGTANPLTVLDYRDGMVTGSNPFAVAVVGKMLRPQGIRVATQADLERITATGALNLRGTYTDTALVLRTEEDQDRSDNTYLARDLADQLRKRGAKNVGKVPIVVPLQDVTVRRDASSKYGLAFDIDEGAQYFEAPILKKGGQFDTKEIDPKTGLPTQVKGGDRTLYTRNSGLSRLFLYWSLGVDSYGERLAGSDGDGRVVVVRGEAARADLEGQLRSQFAAQESELRARYTAAVKVLNGEK